MVEAAGDGRAPVQVRGTAGGAGAPGLPACRGRVPAHSAGGTREARARPGPQAPRSRRRRREAGPRGWQPVAGGGAARVAAAGARRGWRRRPRGRGARATGGTGEGDEGR